MDLDKLKAILRTRAAGAGQQAQSLGSALLSGVRRASDRANTALADTAMARVEELGDLGSQIRYGMPLHEKEAMAIRGEVPGFDPKNLATPGGQDIEQRRAAAFAFGKQWPRMGPEWQPFIDKLRLAVGDDPRLLQITQDAVEQGAAAARR